MANNKLSLAILFTFLLPTSFAQSNPPPSSVRRSLNWVLPSYDIQPSTLPAFSPQLVGFNSRPQVASVLGGSSQEVANVVGDIAKEFLGKLHPSLKFKLTDSYLSQHSQIGHAHFVQLVKNEAKDGEAEWLEVSNANVNLNIDLKNRRILNVFDGSYPEGEVKEIRDEKLEECETLLQKLEMTLLGLDSDHAAVKSLKAKRDQLILTTPQDAPLTPSELILLSPSEQDLQDLGLVISELATLSSCGSPFLMPQIASTPTLSKNEEPLTDPRLSLLSFLSVAHPEFVQDSLLPNGLGLDSFSVVYDMDNDHYEIDYNHELGSFAPSTSDHVRKGNFFEKPVSAKLTYLISGGNLVKTWKLSIPSNLNHYEAYVSATEPFGSFSGVSAETPVKMVVDYVRDFRPTGGEITTPVDSVEGGWWGDLSGMWNVQASAFQNQMNALSYAETSDIKGFGRHLVVSMQRGGEELFRFEEMRKVAEGSDCHHKKLRFGKPFGDKLRGKSLEPATTDPDSGSPADDTLPILPDVGPIYRVFPWSTNDPTEGHRHTLLKHQEDTSASKKVTDLDWEASPVGWHRIPDSLNEKAPAKKNPASGWENDEDWLERVGHGEEARFWDTRGNNVFAQDNPSGGFSFASNHRPSGLPTYTHGHNYSSSVPYNTSYHVTHPLHELNFTFPLGFSYQHNATCGEPGCEAPEPSTYIDASVTELFYTINEIHDLFYRYGFDEVSGNFQEFNFGKGGLGQDAVQANAQDGSGTNNANFATPPDGQRGRMRMYIWTTQEPYRDGDLEAGIVIHEYAHGISNRLTGGPANAACLGWGEAGGMGEGWGDALATIIRMDVKGDTTNLTYGMGDWASGREGGIRKYKYTRDMTVNPETYKVLDGFAYFGVHAIGEVWAGMLYEITLNLVDKHGFSKSLFPPTKNTGKHLTVEEAEFYYINEKTGLKVPKHGNTLMLQLIVDGMKLQPCRPNFFSARDAILQADEILTGGENACEIWQGFSKRGLGPDAKLIGATPWGGGVRTEDFIIPSDVCKKPKNDE